MNVKANDAVQTLLQKTGAKSASELETKLTVNPANLNREALKFSYDCINEAYDIQIRKGGIEEVQGKLKELQGMVGEQVYAVAKRAIIEVGKNLKFAAAYFKALCTQAEQQLINKHAKEAGEKATMSDLVPLWSQYKTSIAKGMELGIDPDEPIPDTDTPKYAMAAQYRTEVQKRERQTGANTERNTSKQTATQFQLVAKGWSEKLTPAMGLLVTEMNRLNHTDQDEFAVKVMALANEVHALAEQRLQESLLKAANTPVVGATEAAGSGGDTSDLSDVDPGTKAAMQAALDTHEKEGKPAEGKVVAQELARAGRHNRKHGGRKARQA